jgi:SAM-dependent methyltransferase
MDLKSRVPESLKAIARPLAWRLSDTASKLRGSFMPPRRLVVQVPGDFKSVGREFLGYFQSLGNLRPDQRILDIGCGPGRMAIPLTYFLSARGSYDGIDTWTEGVDWCANNITPRFANFHFSALDDPGPGGMASFPFEDGTFDFAILGAISRLDEPTFRSYVKEAGRVLRPGGTYLGTSFVRSLEAEGSGGQAPDGPVGHEGRLIFSKKQIEELLGSSGLLLDAIYPGRWDGDPAALSYQDILVAKKRGA